ncbi:MAG: MFS transporter, partial [Solirubrobacteraceae bacterium]
ALAIALFYAIGTAIGGITGPLLFAKLVGSGDASQVAYGYLLGAALMIGAGVVQATIGLEVAQQRLEDIATPITAEEGEAAPDGEPGTDGEASGKEPTRTRPTTLPWTRTRSSWSQAPVASPRPATDVNLSREVESIVRALESHGPQRREDLGRLVGARYWGPRRFTSALRAAIAQGRVRRTGRNRFEPASSIGGA